NRGQFLINAIDRGVRRRGVSNRNLADFPAKDVGMVFFEDDTTVADANDRCPLGACLTEETSLKVPGEHDVRVRTENIAFVEMAQSPVAVALVRKRLDGARGVTR